MVKRTRDGTEISSLEETSETTETNEDARVDAINSLHDDELRKIFEILGEENFLPVAGTCKRFNTIYKQVHPDCETSVEDLVQSVSGAALFLSETGRGVRFRLYIKVPCSGFGTRNIPTSHTAFSFIRDVAALHGRLEVLKWIQSCCRRPRFDGSSTCAFAAMNGHLSVLQWLREQGNPWSNETCYWAAAKGQLEVLKWAMANGCAGNKNICNLAARFGQLDVLKWARTNGCPWDNWTRHYAYIYGHTDVVEWAQANGLP